MKRIIIFILTTCSLSTFSQGNEENILYVVDSIPVTNDPGEGDGELLQENIETVTILTDRAEVEKYGFKGVEKMIFIFTKEYAQRPEEIRKIPSTKQMERKNGKWCMKNSATPYSGRFIDYFFNGKKQGEGTFNAGLAEGLRTVYYADGSTSYYRNFSNGLEHGESKEFFANGKIHQEGSFKNGKEDGIWKEWYSTGELKRQMEFTEGKANPTKEDDKFHKLLANGIELFREENYKGAVKSLDKAIELNPNYSDVYFNRGTAYLYDLKFDEAIADFDKAIQLEPQYMASLSNRAFARLRKFEFLGSRVLKQTHGVTVLAGKEKVEIPKEEQEKICSDLNAGYKLGDKKPMILDAIKKYCQ